MHRRRRRDDLKQLATSSCLHLVHYFQFCLYCSILFCLIKTIFGGKKQIAYSFTFILMIHRKQKC
jgi:hypothetical protein